MDFPKINKEKIELLDDLIEKYLTSRSNLKELFINRFETWFKTY